MEPKKPWQSKTMIINTVMAILSAIAVFFPQVGGVGEFITSHAAIIGMVWSVAGIALRMITQDKIQLGE